MSESPLSRALLTLGVVGIPWAGFSIRSEVIRSQAVQTATMAEIREGSLPVYVANVRDDSAPETYYVRSLENGKTKNCYLAIDGKAVFNTCYLP